MNHHHNNHHGHSEHDENSVTSKLRSAVVFVLGFLLVAGIFYFTLLNVEDAEVNEDKPEIEETVDTEKESEEEDMSDKEESEEKEEKTEEKVDVAVTETEVELASIKQLSDEAVLGSDIQLEIREAYAKLYKRSEGETKLPEWTSLDEMFKFYDVGEFTEGEYKGHRLLVLRSTCEGPCFSDPIYRFAWDKEKNNFVLLAKYSPEWIPPYIEPIASVKDVSTVIPELTFLNKLSVPGKDGIQLGLSRKDAGYLNFTETNKKAFKHEIYGDVYFVNGETMNGKAGHSCFRVKGFDGSIATYDFNPNFFDGKVYAEWSDGSEKTNLENYFFNTEGCGIYGACYHNVEVEDGELQLVAKSTNGYDLYELKNPSADAAAKNAHDDPNLTQQQLLYGRMYLTYRYKKSNAANTGTYADVDFGEFLDLKPVLYFKDPWGRWATMVHNETRPAAECGKPVVYLYPEEETDVNVQVDIDEFTVTIPDYGRDGWNVRAYPDGQIYNYDDGKDYPYLFWEGKKRGGMSPNRGFVVARDEINEFLNDSLDKLGLNSTEKADFLEFWEERILRNNSPYFFISFLGTQEFNKVAPLHVKPEPDTLIRVFMYYHPVYSHFEVEPQKLSKIERKGFTVIEWGGTSSALWQD